MASKEDLLKQVDEEFEDDFESLEGCQKLKERMEARLKSLEEEVCNWIFGYHCARKCVIF